MNIIPNHKFSLRPGPFNKIKTGIKVIEMRLYDEKRKLIKVGDIISFENTLTKEIIYVKVLELNRFPTFKEIYETYPKRDLGYLDNETADYHDMSQYYSEENIAKYGALAIHISLIKE